MANPGNQMHLVTSSARQASAKSADTATQLNNLKTKLDGDVTAVIGSGWVMLQAGTFHQAHTHWSEAMAALHVALVRFGDNSTSHAVRYEHNDTEQAAGFNRIQSPSLGAIMRA